MLSFLTFFGAEQTVHADIDPSIFANIDSSQITLVHAIRVHHIEDWKREFLDEYIESGRPPRRWLETGAWHGIMVSEMDRVDLKEIDYQTALKNTFFERSKSSLQFAEAQKRSAEPYIIFLANPMPDARWTLASRNDPAAKRLRLEWWKQPRNWFRFNEYLFRHYFSLYRDWRIAIRHSAMADDYKLIGHIKDPVGGGRTLSDGTWESRPFYSAVVTNEKMFESSKLIVPSSLSPTGEEIQIFSESAKGLETGPVAAVCESSFRRVR